MDIFTLTVMQSLANGIQVAALYGQYRTDRTHEGPDLWTLGSACVALGFVFNSLRDLSGFGPVAIVANNALFFAGLSLLYVGVLRFFGQRERRRWLEVSGTVFILLIIYFTFFSNDLSARRVLISTAVAALSFLISRALYVHTIRSVTTSAYFLATVFAAFGCFFVLRAVTPFAGILVTDPSILILTQTATYLATFIASTLWTFGFIIMVNQRLNTESRESKEHFELFFNTSPDAVLITSLHDGRFADINDGFTALTGYTRAEVLGRSALDVNLWNDPEDRLLLVAKLAAEGTCENHEVTFQHKNGATLIGMMSAKVIMLRGEPHIISVTRNITERKEAEKALCDSEEKYRVLFRDSPDAYLIIADGIFVDCNQATEKMLRGSRDRIIGQAPDLLSPEFQPDGRKSSESAEEKINKALKTGNNSFEWVHRRLDGGNFYVEVSIASMMLNGKPVLFTTWRDITERKKVEDALARSEVQFRTLFDSTSEAVMFLNEDGIFDCNKAALDMFGYATREELCSTHPGKLSPPQQPCGADSLALANAHIRATIEKGNHSFEWLHQRADNGKLFPAEVLLCAVELDGSTIIQATVRDITERKQVERTLEDSNRKLETLSITDGLTGIANRRHFDAVLAQEHARHCRSGTELALILLDIDHFKSFNDTYGHIKGDECLRQIGRVLSECTSRPADVAARYGGEEFACILPETDRSGAIIIAERIRRGIMALAIPHRRSHSAECVTASLGVVSVQCTADNTADEILGQVDELLYRAKSSGRNRVEFDATTDAESLPGRSIKGNFVQLAWKDSFRCGNQVIDSQHQALFHVANELFEAVLSGRPAAEVSDVIARLLGEAGRHFHDEEKILETIGFTGIAQHMAEHAALLTKGEELSRQFSAGELTVGNVFQYLAYDVVMVHMLGADREYFPIIGEAEIAGVIS